MPISVNKHPHNKHTTYRIFQPVTNGQTYVYKKAYTKGGNMKRRTLIRVISFAVIAAAVLLVKNIMLMRENKSALLTIENGYSRAIEELSAAADNIRNALQKELYAGTADMHQKLSQQLWRDSSTAKAALAQLPVKELQLENTYKFLSQVGNYALSVSEKVREGKDISPAEYKSLSSLYEFSKRLCDDMWKLENDLAGGDLTLTEAADAGTEKSPPGVADGFTDFEEGFDSYPTLIYDGPFSDHIMEKQPLMTKGKQEVTQETAHRRASGALGIDIEKLDITLTENGKMPSFLFTVRDGSASCAVTKQGGYISYFLKSRDVIERNISREEALEAADKCLESIGVSSMMRTYHEEIGNILTVNYAYRQDDICCYTDLIKVSVAMDNGEVIAYDARGYLVNHIRREFKDDRKSVLDLQKKVSPHLTVLSRQLAVIPSDSTEELLCYEYKCETSDGTHVLVYFNAFTGKEEQILILFESESGILTM